MSSESESEILVGAVREPIIPGSTVLYKDQKVWKSSGDASDADSVEDFGEDGHQKDGEQEESFELAICFALGTEKKEFMNTKVIAHAGWFNKIYVYNLFTLQSHYIHFPGPLEQFLAF
jgi:hypothetical protein